MKRYALISVSDKSGIDRLAQQLTRLGFEIISTGGTAAYLEKQDIATIRISDLTGFPEIMDGRVKTLHPKVHGGILADLDLESHRKIMQELSIHPIELVIVNLYPFEKTVANPASTQEEIIENIDIGGPTLIRSAAKNFRHVTVLTDPSDYDVVLDRLNTDGKTSLELRRMLAAKAFYHVKQYDIAISDWFNRHTQPEQNQNEDNSLGLDSLELSIPLAQVTRYGENPHQAAGYFSRSTQGWQCVHGKPLSYNNLLDLDAALKAILLFNAPTAMIFKHTNPCGIGSADSLAEAYQKAFASDPLSPYGGIIAVNRKLDMLTVEKINEIFSEIIIAPDYEPDALEVLKKRKDRRLVVYHPDAVQAERPALEVRSIISGYLVQEWDKTILSEEAWQVVTSRKPDPEELEALRFAWKCVSLLKSNAIALTLKDRTIGLGIGQTSRVDSTEIAIRKALQFKHELSRAVCASDGFFPFRDSVELLHQHGIRAVIQPGGSKGDNDVIAACDEMDIAMIMTGMRHFRH
jgi:phosphoribosylaminoimidazolecarboxamide formyltransferase/IMP cyclohydrolase